MRKHNHEATPDAHDSETYCQRPNHGGSLANHQIRNEDQRPERSATGESGGGHPLDALGREPAENRKRPHRATGKSARQDQRSSAPHEKLEQNAGDGR